MLLRSRYIVVLNVVILTSMTVFFVIDDYRLRRSHIEAVSAGTLAGIYARAVADRVVADIQEVVTAEKLVEDVRRDVHAMAGDEDLQAVLDVRVTVSIDEPTVIASLTGDAEGTVLHLSRNELSQLTEVIKEFGSATSGIVVGMQLHDEVWVTRLIVPYSWDAMSAGDAATSYVVRVGLVEILLDSRHLPEYWQSFRLIHLLFVVLLAITLTIFIDMTTDRMVLRPLEQLTDIVRRGERGDVEADVSFPNNEVGQVAQVLTDMLASMKRLHADRVQALERLASGVAHEIRNPLNAISMSALYLRDVLRPGSLSTAQVEDAGEVLDTISGEVTQLNRITSQFLNLTRPQQMEWTMGDIREQVSHALSQQSLPLKDAGVTVSRDFAEDLPAVAMDIVRLRSAIYNLVQNAIEAMPYGGRLDVRITRVDGGVAAEIHDTGHGMSSETLGRIFDPYFTSREREGGLGLGLTLAQSAVASHNGRLEVVSEEGSGTTFTVVLPLRPDLGERTDQNGG